MLKNHLSFLILLFSLLLSCSPDIKQYQIIGIISDPLENVIEIDGLSIPVSEDGVFSFVKEIDRPVFLDISYADLEWTVFLEPQSSLDIHITGKSLDDIEYKGDLISSNTYLLEVGSVSQEINAFLNQNWVPIHQQNQVDYISSIDSLKGVFLEHLIADPERYQSFSKAFVMAWKTDLDFALNKIMLYYPRNHFNYTGEKVELNDESISYIKVPEIDTLACIDLPNYKDFTEDWIDYHTERLVEKEAPVKHYNLMKIDAVSRLIPELFTSSLLKIGW